jgi:hypothetical protein
VEADRHQNLDDLAFVIALAAVAAAGAGFFAQRNGAALVMCALCFAGIFVGRMIGISGRTLLPVGLGLAVILYLVWLNPPLDSRETSAVAHIGGGALAGWALGATLRRRVAWPGWALIAFAAVVVLTGIWEIGEYLGDRALDTALIPNRSDSAYDVVFGCAGGFAGVCVARLAELVRGSSLR